MTERCIRFRGEVSNHLGWPDVSRITIRETDTGASVAELRLEGIRPTDLDGKTLVIELGLAPHQRQTKVQVSRKEDLTTEDWARLRRQKWSMPFRDSFD